MSDLLLRDGLVLDVRSGDYSEASLRCVDGRIAEIGRGLTASAEARVVDLAGAVVLPGLIDAHVHVTAATAALGELPTWPPSYVAAHAARIMGSMLRRGFTTVRDAAGADYGLADAQAEGLIVGPRLAFCGKALSQTGGHGDLRGRGASASDDHPCCAGLGQVADGVDAVRVAARNELRKGAHHIKVMASGGVASPTDRIDSTQYSMEELRAVVEEAEAANRYVAAHAYTARAVNRALEAGVRSIEHGNLIDERSVELFLAHDAYLVPTLVTYWALKQEGEAHGLPADSHRKVDEVLEGGLRALERAARSGVKLVYGSDLLGGMHRYQSHEFLLRGEVQQPIDVIRAATVTAAELLGLAGEIGEVRVGAQADLVVLERDPLVEVGVLAVTRHIVQVVQEGRIVSDGRAV
ncbi:MULTISPECIES: amidohydrolase family protein [unclassified Crossiella]|uniref:metal-dependent hydrolase family protein n=1 Tax=unclassified Crossiella TaxID=2620835 RepID=UPI001FFF3914|nr:MULTISPECIES: amidohydrolase family protein [unclassified Crossiella]MCK2239121.1 amidohydrolase family protein [Crossiella sp. S99.2]MCK2251310.1 amidohydrolase family protein [Crossiella sp. S99.1]